MAGGVDYDRAAADFHHTRGRTAALAAWRAPVVEALAGAPAGPIVDLGAGTGAWSAALVEWTGRRVLAVEPSAGMRAEFAAGRSWTAPVAERDRAGAGAGPGGRRDLAGAGAGAGPGDRRDATGAGAGAGPGYRRDPAGAGPGDRRDPAGAGAGAGPGDRRDAAGAGARAG
ncbi:MAG TPA: hypothetical protein VKB57_24295, partial [Acidimicrobiales bacterium]|nr:hypothetical protein [Acidimicrobiales bacterium]